MKSGLVDAELSAPAARVWPWYAGGTGMLLGALALALIDFEPRAHATETVVAAAPAPDVPSPEPEPAPDVPSAVSRAPSPSPAPVSPPPAPAPAPPAASTSTSTSAHTPTAPSDRELAKSLNSQGFAARKDGDHPRARALYREAADADHAHVWSRYNLACEHALLGDVDESLALLQRIADIGGDDADRALYVHAPKDKDFSKLRKNRRFQRLTTR